MIVTDHHLPEAELPPALAVLNPNRRDCGYPEKHLCGAGVTLNVTLPGTPPTYAPENGEDRGCKNSNDLFGVSQASPVRSVIVNGALILQDYCNRGFVSGGFFANDELNGFVGNFGQQQFFTRNSNVGQWSNAVWNQVFLGDNGAPATNFGPGQGQYTNVSSARVSQEPPFLTTDDAGNWSVFVPAVQHHAVGPNYSGGSVAGTSIPIRRCSTEAMSGWSVISISIVADSSFSPGSSSL